MSVVIAADASTEPDSVRSASLREHALAATAALTSTSATHCLGVILIVITPVPTPPMSLKTHAVCPASGGATVLTGSFD